MLLPRVQLKITTEHFQLLSLPYVVVIMLSYRYSPLQHTDSIRILVLHPSSEESDPITCTIQQRRLCDAYDEYEALSYTWGDPTRRHEICFRNSTRRLTVGTNCHDALRNLRLKHEDRLLWIDAICINQGDLIERAQQVRIMDDVFSSALKVVVYLGEQVPESIALFEELAAADALLRLDGNCDRPRPSDAIIRELGVLFERPWFKRVWVLQEVCAKEFVQFMYGSATASFAALTELYFGYKSNYFVGEKHWPIALEWTHRPPEVFSSPQYNLWNRLYETRDCVATDPKDKIFALKSLVGTEQKQMDYLIDYAQSLEECFINVARFLLPVLGLRLLVAARHPHCMGIPSWIPDWSQNFALTYDHFEPFDGKLRGQPTPCFESCKEPKYTIQSFGTGQMSKYHLELLVPGVQYAQVIERSQCFQLNDLEDTERQVKRLYISIWNYEQDIKTGSVCSDAIILEQPGSAILNGKDRDSA
jgi:hypothetical protein